MNLIEPYIESFISQLRYSSSTKECKGIITFDEIKEDLKRERITNQMIEEYKSQIERRGIEVDVDNDGRVVYITIRDQAKLILTPAQMRQKNEAIEHFRNNYE